MGWVFSLQNLVGEGSQCWELRNGVRITHTQGASHLEIYLFLSPPTPPTSIALVTKSEINIFYIKI